MRALVADPAAPQGLSLREAPDPEPRPDHALVELRATSINRGEVRRLRERPEGFVTGWDVAGVVTSAADEGGPPEGARVVGLVNPGAWAELVSVPVRDLAELPGDVSFEDAATLPVAGLTALKALEVGGLALGRRVLVTGAAGGVGRFAVQLAHAAGAHVIAVVGSEERGRGLRELGADEVVVGFQREGGELDTILESAGGESLAAALGRVSKNGVIVAFGNSSGEETTFDVSGFYGRAAGARLYAFMIFDEVAKAGGAARDLGKLARLVAAGDLRTGISLRADFYDPDEAIASLMDRRVAGKAVLVRG